MRLPTVCARFLVPVRTPARTNDARLAALRFAGAYRLANGRIVGARGCYADERRLYSGAHAGAKPERSRRIFFKAKGPRQ